MNKTEDKIKEAFTRLAEATKGLRGAAIILNAAADLRYIAEELLIEKEESKCSHKADHKEVLGHVLCVCCTHCQEKVRILTGGLEKIRASKHLEKPRCLCAYAGQHLCCVETAMETLTASEKWTGRKE